MEEANGRIRFGWFIAAAMMAVLCIVAPALAPASAFADDAQILSEGNFTYTVSDGTATIVGTAGDVTGELTIPGTIGGYTVTNLGDEAFKGRSMTSVAIPASVETIPTACFRECGKLVSVKFEGDSIGSLGSQAFYRCTALTRFDIPVLTKDLSEGFFRIGGDCFSGCTSLKTIVFTGDGNTKSSSYFSPGVSNYSVFTGCTSLEEVIFECKKCDIPSMGQRDSNLTKGRFYYTVEFYESEADSKASKDPLYSITCRGLSGASGDTTGVSLRDIIDGKVEAGNIWGTPSGTLPAAPSGKVWGIEDHAFISASTQLDDSYHVVPVSQNNLDFGWVASPVTDSYIDESDLWSTNFPMFYLASNGTVDKVDTFAAYGADGNAVSPSDYKLVFEQADVRKNPNGSRSTSGWKTVSSVSGAGVYRVHAEGTAASNQGTKTDAVSFEVEAFTPKVSELAGSGASCWASVTQAISTAVKARGTVYSGVVVPAGDWRNQLIGAALAGVSNGPLLIDNGEDYSGTAVTAFAESGATAVQIVGSTNAVPQSASGASPRYLADYLQARSNVVNRTRYSNDSSIQELSDQVYTTIKRLHDSGNAIYGTGWGTAAIVASPSANMDVLTIAQYAYANKAPVFFVQNNGSLSSTDLGYLANGGFTSIAIAGDTGYVSDACMAAIAQATGITPTRLLAQGSDSLGAVMGDLGALGYGTGTFVLASAAHDANVTVASALAAATGGTALTVSCSADSKRIQEYLLGVLAAKGQTAIANVTLVGDFTNVDPTLPSRISDLWTAPQSTAIGVGDTVEVGDFTYKLTGAQAAQLAMLRNHAAASATVGNMSYNGASYKVSSIAAGAFSGAIALTGVKLGAIASVPDSAFAGCTALKSVTGSSVTRIGASAFSGCEKLTTVPVSKATKVGASAFSGCTALAKISLPKATSIGASAFEGCVKLKTAVLAKATSIGASAFSGCNKLKSVTLKATGLKKIGKKAFNGCSALKTLKMKAKKLTKSKVGSSAFSGMPKKAKVYVPAAKVTSYQAIFRAKGLPKKATVTAIK